MPSFTKLGQRYLSKYKDIKKNVRELNKKNVVLEKLNNDLHDKVKCLGTKKVELKAKCDKDHKIILKFT